MFAAETLFYFAPLVVKLLYGFGALALILLLDVAAVLLVQMTRYKKILAALSFEPTYFVVVVLDCAAARLCYFLN